VETRIPASERTSQKLNELLTHGVADGDARAELLKLAVRKIVEETLEAEVSEALGRGYYENGAEPGRGYRNGYRRGRLRTAEGAIEYGVPQSPIALSRLCRASGPAWRDARPSSSSSPWRCTRAG
jgi:putative transposase